MQAGAVAGTSVDVVLFPLDTVKTRLQSQQGFWAAGGFRGIYSGLLSAFLGSAPTGEAYIYYIYIYICIYLSIYLYIYIEREREREMLSSLLLDQNWGEHVVL